MNKKNKWMVGTALLSSVVGLNLVFATASFAAEEPNYNPNALPAHPAQVNVAPQVSGVDEFHYFTFPMNPAQVTTSPQVTGVDEFHYFSFPVNPTQITAKTPVQGTDEFKYNSFPVNPAQNVEHPQVQGTDEYKYNSLPAHKVDPATEQQAPALPADWFPTIFG